MDESSFNQYDTHIFIDRPARFPALLVCDHASAHIPPELDNLGLTASQLEGHIAWDIGAGDVATFLGELLGLPVVLATHSRLVVDCNRNLDDPTAFPAVSDGVVVPRNVNLSSEERQARANAFYWPYHHAIRDRLRRLESRVQAPALIAVHSFTPVMEGFKRPWHIGALWDKDERLSLPLIRHLEGQQDIVVGDNEPYSGRHPADFTLDHHAEAEGLAHLGIEVRQDLIDHPEGARKWAGILADALGPILEDETVYTLRAGAPI